MIERALQRIAVFARRRYGRVFAVFAVLLVIAIGFASQLRIDTEILNLLPQDDPQVKIFRESLEEFGSLDYLMVVVRIPEQAVVDPYLELADELALRFDQLDEVQYVDYSLGDLEELLQEFYPQAFLFLDEEGRGEVERRLTEQAIASRVEELKRQVVSPQSIALRELMTIDPFGLAEIFVDQVTGSRGDLKVDWSKGYFLSNDRSLLLLLVKPSQPAQEIEFARRLIDAVNGEIELALQEWPALAAEAGYPTPVVELGGTSAIAVEDTGTLVRDVALNGVTSMIGVLVLFTVAFRRVGLVLYAFIPLSCGLVLAFGFAGMTVGTLNALTSGFAALLVGLGIDFIIVSYGRYVEERNRGARLSTALRRMGGSSGRAVVTGAVTTAATFYAFTITEFAGLKQMGFLIGTGILFCMVSVLVLLPALLAWRVDRRSRRGRAAGTRARASEADTRATSPPLYFRGFGASRLIAWSFHHPVPVLVVGLIVTLATGLLATRLEFVDSIRSMRPEGNRGMQVQDEVAARFGSGFDYMTLIVTGESEEAILERSAEVTARAEQLVESGVLRGVDSIASVLAPPDQQREALAWLETQREGVLAPGRARDSFERAARAVGLRAAGFERGLALLERAAATDEPVRLANFAAREETRRLLGRYVHDTSDGWKSVVYLHPPPRLWKREAPPEVVELASQLGEDVTLSGTNLVSERLRNVVREDAEVAAIVGLIVVAFLLWLDYRKLSDTLLSLAPLGVGIVWMLGGMVLFGIEMNFFNVFVTTMIIGIGVDYGVHMMHRYHELAVPVEERAGRGREDLVTGLGETGKAIVLAAASTSVGFGSMSISHYPGLRSMGAVAIMGALATAVVAITLLPAFLGLRASRRRELDG